MAFGDFTGSAIIVDYNFYCVDHVQIAQAAQDAGAVAVFYARDGSYCDGMDNAEPRSSDPYGPTDALNITIPYYMVPGGQFDDLLAINATYPTMNVHVDRYDECLKDAVACKYHLTAYEGPFCPIGGDYDYVCFNSSQTCADCPMNSTYLTLPSTRVTRGTSSSTNYCDLPSVDSCDVSPDFTSGKYCGETVECMESCLTCPGATSHVNNAMTNYGDACVANPSPEFCYDSLTVYCGIDNKCTAASNCQDCSGPHFYEDTSENTCNPGSPALCDTSSSGVNSTTDAYCSVNSLCVADCTASCPGLSIKSTNPETCVTATHASCGDLSDYYCPASSSCVNDCSLECTGYTFRTIDLAGWSCTATENPYSCEYAYDYFCPATSGCVNTCSSECTGYEGYVFNSTHAACEVSAEGCNNIGKSFCSSSGTCVDSCVNNCTETGVFATGSSSECVAATSTSCKDGLTYFCGASGECVTNCVDCADTGAFTDATDAYCVAPSGATCGVGGTDYCSSAGECVQECYLDCPSTTYGDGTNTCILDNSPSGCLTGGLYWCGNTTSCVSSCSGECDPLYTGRTNATAAYCGIMTGADCLANDEWCSSREMCVDSCNYDCPKQPLEDLGHNCYTDISPTGCDAIPYTNGYFYYCATNTTACQPSCSTTYCPGSLGTSSSYVCNIASPEECYSNNDHYCSTNLTCVNDCSAECGGWLVDYGVGMNETCSDSVVGPIGCSEQYSSYVDTAYCPSTNACAADCGAECPGYPAAADGTNTMLVGGSTRYYALCSAANPNSCGDPLLGTSKAYCPVHGACVDQDDTASGCGGCVSGTSSFIKYDDATNVCVQFEAGVTQCGIADNIDFSYQFQFYCQTMETCVNDCKYECPDETNSTGIYLSNTKSHLCEHPSESSCGASLYPQGPYCKAIDDCLLPMEEHNKESICKDLCPGEEYVWGFWCNGAEDNIDGDCTRSRFFHCANKTQDVIAGEAANDLADIDNSSEDIGWVTYLIMGILFGGYFLFYCCGFILVAIYGKDA